MLEAKRSQLSSLNPLQMTPIRPEREERREERERVKGLPVGYVPGWARDEECESEGDHSGSERDS